MQHARRHTARCCTACMPMDVNQVGDDGRTSRTVDMKQLQLSGEVSLVVAITINDKDPQIKTCSA